MHEWSISLFFPLCLSSLSFVSSGRATFLSSSFHSRGGNEKKEREKDSGQRDGLIAEKITISLRLSHVKAPWIISGERNFGGQWWRGYIFTLRRSLTRLIFRSGRADSAWTVSGGWRIACFKMSCSVLAINPYPYSPWSSHLVYTKNKLDFFKENILHSCNFIYRIFQYDLRSQFCMPLYECKCRKCYSQFSTNFAPSRLPN